MREPETFDELLGAYRVHLGHFVDLKIEGNNIIERIFAKEMPSPFLSLLIDDCIEKGEDYHDTGPRYRTTYIQGVGLGTLTDSVAAIRCHVYEEDTLDLSDLMDALGANFAGHDALRQTLLHRAPKFGNDDAYADDIAALLFEEYFQAVDGRPNTKGGHYRVNLLPTTVHIYFGSVVGALPNGRLAGEPLSEGISPSQGADVRGPTAVVRSAASIDHVRTGGTLLNQKFSPEVLDGETGIDNLVQLIRGYFRMGGHHIQFNVISGETLRAARENPNGYRDLIVRVAGYSDYFAQLGGDLQDEIIARTEQHGF
jgi:formate C-acetyltransferase